MSEAPAMSIRALAPWFGSKRTLAPRIVAELGPHRAYWEPMCGSMSVLLAKPRCSIESVNDLYGPLVNLARVLASDRWPDLYASAQRVLQCEPLLAEYRRRLCDGMPAADSIEAVADEHVEAAVVFLALSWIGRNGEAGTRTSNHSYAVRFTQSGGSPNVRWRGVLDSIPGWHERLQGVSILHRDAVELIGRIEDEPGTAVYADPPYFKETRGSGGGVVYEHDFSDGQHERLAAALGRFHRARVVVSYYDDPRLDELYAGWTKLDVATLKNMANASRRASRHTTSPEVLLVNGPSLAAEGAQLFARANEGGGS